MQIAGTLYPPASTQVFVTLYPPAQTQVVGTLYPPTQTQVVRNLYPSATVQAARNLYPPATVQAARNLYPPATVQAAGNFYHSASVQASGNIFPSATVQVDGKLSPPVSVQAVENPYPSATVQITGNLYPSATTQVAGNLFPAAPTQVAGNLYPPATVQIACNPDAPTVQLPNQPIPVDVFKKQSIRISSFARDPASNIKNTVPSITVHHKPLPAGKTGVLAAQFIWYCVESQFRYSLVNSDNLYIIHNTFIANSTDICVKLFVSVEEHARLPRDPVLWENTTFTFLPNWNQPTKAVFHIGGEERFEVHADLPSKVFNVHELVRTKAAFILSLKRLKAFQQGLNEGIIIIFYFTFFTWLFIYLFI